jgi:hypothetical protein
LETIASVDAERRSAPPDATVTKRLFVITDLPDGRLFQNSAAPSGSKSLE